MIASTRSNRRCRTLAALGLVAAGLVASLGTGAPPAGAGVPSPCSTGTQAQIYVCRAYSAFVRRLPVTAELEYWVPQLPARRTFFTATLARSLESREEVVEAYYQDMAFSAPSEADVDYWVGRVLAPNGLRSLEAALVATRGGTDTEYVEDLYRFHLDREPSPTELTYWLGRLAVRGRNLTGADVGHTSEARRLRVRWTYQNELGYFPDDASRDYWSERLRTGTSFLDLRIALRSTDDGYEFTNGSCAPAAPRSGPYCL